MLLEPLSGFSGNQEAGQVRLRGFPFVPSKRYLAYVVRKCRVGALSVSSRGGGERGRMGYPPIPRPLRSRLSSTRSKIVLVRDILVPGSHCVKVLLLAREKDPVTYDRP